MGLATDRAARLKDVLKEATVNVQRDGRSRGTAFYISNTLLLTSQHVLSDASEVDVVTVDGTRRRATAVQPNPGAADDLALLRTELTDEAAVQPAVLLREDFTEGSHFVVGYPADPGQPAGQEGFTITAHERGAPVGAPQEGPQKLQLEAGKVITFGMSGGPVLSLESGAVVAVVRSVNDPSQALGGGAIPVSSAARHYPEVRELLRDPPVAVRRWRSAVGLEHWQHLGLMWDMETVVDLSVSGSRNEWCIRSEATDVDGDRISAPNLGDDVTEAMFRWAQRRRISVKEEVDLLGGLLSKALFPDTVKTHLHALSQADRVSVRLHIAADTGLADIPWELACVPGRSDFMAADSRFQFLRVDDSAPRVSSRPVVGAINVLVVIGLPQSWQYPTVYGEQPYPWPPVEDIEVKLRSHFRPSVFELTTLVDKGPWDVHDELESNSYDLLHYIGVGRTSLAGSAQLSLVEPFDGDVQWQDANELLKWAAASGVRVALLEFTGPPVGLRLEPVSPSSLGEVLRDDLGAVVLTRFPVHPRQFYTFNGGFYDALRRGASLPAAVQEGRHRLWETPGVEDVAGFGCFALTTGALSDLRLVPRQAPAPGARNARSGASGSERPQYPDRVVEAQPAAAGRDSFGGVDR